MRLSTKARYAVMALVDLTYHSNGAPLSIATIAGRQNLPIPYLEQIFNRLKKANIVVSSRGVAGGYLLAKPATQTYIEDIISVVDHPLKATRCSTQEAFGCQEKGSRCLTHDLWSELENVVHSFLSKVSLEDVCQQKVLGQGLFFIHNKGEHNNL